MSIVLISLRAALVAVGALLAAPVAALAVTGAPTGLTATTPTKAKPDLTWTAPAAPGAGIAGYNVYRGATKANTTVVTGTTYTDNAATANTTPSYTVKAVETGTNLESAASPGSRHRPSATAFSPGPTGGCAGKSVSNT